ncbi:hypothetical protein KP509_1Z000200 [Ceratopteris richardii]|nr:hypothetical protein KP509_1Z000200 [Ceratopteris richardii]
METQEVKDGAGGGGTDKRAVNSRNNHGAAGRRHSMLSKQIETQASTWAAGDRMVAAAAAEEANKESCVVHEYNGEIIGEAGSGDGVNGPYRHVGKLIPPHELLARQYSSSASFSVLHGAGRTLKGMDLKRLRNEVWRQTGFVD